MPVTGGRGGVGMADRILPELRFLPAVFAVGEHYQILTWARSELLLGVEVNGVRYFDHSGGIVRSIQMKYGETGTDLHCVLLSFRISGTGRISAVPEDILQSVPG